jgi:tRNA-Thr(GGU) m(6)t(6)A37 methyltransferase TsaA
MKNIEFKPIGYVKSPYITTAPYQPVMSDYQDFQIVINPELADGLTKLSTFKYIYVLFYLHKNEPSDKLLVSPSWSDVKDIGVFATRSPNRPNPIGLSIVYIRSIENNIIHTTGLDVFDGTPVLDIKPYIQELDTKYDANYGWVKGDEDADHLALHIKGIPHDH